MTTGLDIHIIVVDDGSTDGTGDAIRLLSRSRDCRAATYEHTAGTNLSKAALK